MSDAWLRRIAWVTAACALIVLTISAIMLLMSPKFSSLDWILAGDIVALGAPILGVIIVSRHPRNRIGWLWIIYGLLIGFRSLGHGVYFFGGAQPAGYSALEYFLLWLTEPTNISVLACLILLMLWFPDGQLPSRRWRLLYIWLFLAFAILQSSNFVAGPNWNGGAEAGGIVIENPYGWLPAGLENTWLAALGFPSFISLLLITFLSALSLIFRYRSAGPVVRLQLRWFVVGGFFTVILFVLPIFPQLKPSQSDEGFNTLLTLLGQAYIIPLYLAVGVAILRYHLYDFDVIIRKTLVYAVLTGLLALIYFSSVIFIQAVFRSTTGQQSPIVIVISTLLIAALFTPLRRQVRRM